MSSRRGAVPGRSSRVLAALAAGVLVVTAGVATSAVAAPAVTAGAGAAVDDAGQEPTSTEPTSTDPATTEPTTSEPATSEPATTEPTSTEPATSEPATTEPTTTEPSTADPTTTEPTTTEPTTTLPTTTEPTTTEPAEDPGTTPGAFVAVAGRRVLDTRTGMGVRSGWAAGTLTVDVTLAGAGLDAVPARTLGVLATVTAVTPLKGGFLRAAPPGTAPTTTFLTFMAGLSASATTVLPAGADGKVAVTVSGGPTHLVIDVLGYYSATPVAGGRFHAASGRVADSRNGLGLPTGPRNGVRTVDLGAHLPGPVRAVMLDISLTNPAGNGFLRAAGVGRPREVTAMTYLRGKPVTAPVVVSPDAQGRVQIELFGGASDLVVDLLGYYDDSGLAVGTFSTTPPARVLDTRTGFGVPAAGRRAGFIDVALPVAVEPGPLLVSVTAIAPASNGYVQLRGTGLAPVVTSVTYSAGGTQTVLAVVEPADGGRFTVWQFGGAADLVVDLVGVHGTGTAAVVGPGPDCQVINPDPAPFVGGRASAWVWTTPGAVATLVAGYPGGEVAYRATADWSGSAGFTVLAPVANRTVPLRAASSFGGSVGTCAGSYVPRPLPAPSCSVSLTTSSPLQGGTVGVRVGTGLAGSVVDIVTRWASGARTVRVTSDGAGRAGTVLKVGTAPAGRRVPVSVTVRKNGYVRTCGASFVPVAPPTLICRASVSDSTPPQYSWVTVTVRAGIPGARVSTVAHYKTTNTGHSATAAGNGVALIDYYISGATVGRPVPVSVTTSAGGRTKTCSTSFTPR